MRHFEKIRSLDNQERFEQVLAEDNVDVITYEKGDNLTITEKIDGSNAQVMNDNGTLRCFSHNSELRPDLRLDGFYEFVQDNKEILLQLINPGYALFGEWLAPRKVKYPDEAYHKWYLFDICDLTHECSAKDRFLGFEFVKGIYQILSQYDPLPDTIQLVPEYDASQFNPDSLVDFDKIREELSHKSLLGAREGKAEGIVITDNDKFVPIDPGDKEEGILPIEGKLRVKCVNEAFKEVRRAKKPLGEGQKAALDWANKYITEPRVHKKIFSLQEDGIITDELSFEWIRNGNTKKIGQAVLQDALEESVETPEALAISNSGYDKNMKTVQKFANKLSSKVVALKVKGLA